MNGDRLILMAVLFSMKGALDSIDWTKASKMLKVTEDEVREKFNHIRKAINLSLNTFSFSVERDSHTQNWLGIKAAATFSSEELILANDDATTPTKVVTVSLPIAVLPSSVDILEQQPGGSAAEEESNLDSGDSNVHSYEDSADMDMVTDLD